MKKIVYLMMAFLMTAGMAMAQGNGHRGGKPEQKDPKVRAERQTERLAKELSLTDAQKKQVLDLNMERMQNKAECKLTKDAAKGENKTKPTAEEREKMREQKKANCSAYDAKMKSILTPEQYTKLTEMKANRDKKGKGENGKRGKERGGERKQRRG